MMVDPPELTDQERRNITLTALRQAAFDGQKTTLARIHYSHLTRAADEIDRLSERLEAAHGYADECEARIKMLNDQIDAMMQAQGVR